MGILGSKYISDLSDDSDSENHSDLVPGEDMLTEDAQVPDPRVAANFTTDAALRQAVSFPKASEVLTVSKVVEIERELDVDEIVSLGYLLFEETHYTIQKLSLKLADNDNRVLEPWVISEESKGRNWQEKVIEALCIIKNYKVLRELGYIKTNLIHHYMPHNPNVSLHVNRGRKCLYTVCEKLNFENTRALIDHVKHDFRDKNLEFIEYKAEYLELYMLYWETIGYVSTITGVNLENLKRAVKSMKLEYLYNVLDDVSAPQDEGSQIKVIESNPQHMKGDDVNRVATDKFQTHAANIPFSEPSRDHLGSNKTTSLDNDNGQSLCESQLLSSCIGDSSGDADKKYHIDPENPGVVLIINQESFYTEIDPRCQKLLPPDITEKLESRTGTEKDREDLQKVFERFGFKVIVENNLTHLDMIAKIKEVINGVRQESSLFVCILSHGDRGIVYGANSCRVKVSKIQQLLYRTNKTYLAGKPKILILQSCQGQYCQKINDDSDDEESEDSDSNSVGMDGPTRQPLPRTVDVLTFWATVPGYAAIRHKRTGSWFIQSLCRKMVDLSDKYHFADICTRVVNEVAGKTWSRAEDDTNVMIPIVFHTLRGTFYLPPLKSL